MVEGGEVCIFDLIVDENYWVNKRWNLKYLQNEFFSIKKNAIFLEVYTERNESGVLYLLVGVEEVIEGKKEQYIDLIKVDRNSTESPKKEEILDLLKFGEAPIPSEMAFDHIEIRNKHLLGSTNAIYNPLRRRLYVGNESGKIFEFSGDIKNNVLIFHQVLESHKMKITSLI